MHKKFKIKISFYLNLYITCQQLFFLSFENKKKNMIWKQSPLNGTPRVINMQKSKNWILSYLHILIIWFIMNMFYKFQSNWMKNEILVNFLGMKRTKHSSEIISLKDIKSDDYPCDITLKQQTNTAKHFLF